MRIGIFTDTYPPYINGVSTSIVMLERALQKLGHQVFIVTVNSEKLSYNYENDRIIRIPGIPTGIYDYRLSSVYPIRVINKIKKWNLDVIHSQTEFGVGTFARIIANQLDIPLVHTYHTMYEDYVHYITKGYFDGPSKKIVEYLTKFYCDKTASELIVPTKKTYDLFKTKYKFEKRIHIIPTGIEIERFYKENINKEEVEKLRQNLNILENDKVILFVGRLAEEKNVEFLINNHVSILKKHPNTKLVIVGDGPDIEKYKKLSIKNKIEDNVIFTGKVAWESVPLYYALADIFATASTSETQGLTVIEAMAASLAVVAINDEAFNTVIINNLNGMLFENKTEYKKCIENLLDDSNLIVKIGEQARIASIPFSSSYFARRVLDVYKCAIVSSGKSKRGFFKKTFDTLKGGIKWGKK